MFDISAIVAIREDLQGHGHATLTDLSGRALHLVSTGLIGGDGRGLLLAYEGCGAFTFDALRPLNAFRLISAGFPMAQAGMIAELVNKILHPTPPQVANDMAMLHISGPPELEDNTPETTQPPPPTRARHASKLRNALVNPRFKPKARPCRKLRRKRSVKPSQHRKT